MEKKQFSFKKNTGVLLLTVFVFLLSGITSCNEKKGDTETAQFTDMDLSCFILSKTKIANAWPTEEELKSIDYFTFYPSYDAMSKKFSVAVQAFRSDHTQVGGSVALDKGAGCPIKLPYLGTGRNNIDMSVLDILDGSTLKNFDNIKLTPVSFQSAYLSFDVEVVSGGVGRPTAKGALPCPPCDYCKPPCIIILEPTDTLPPNPMSDTLNRQ